VKEPGAAIAARIGALGRRRATSDVALFVGGLALYLKTLSPTVYTFDSAELAAGAYSLGIVHSTGYPLYLLLVKAFMLVVPWGDMAYRANLFSALCAALTLAVLGRAMRWLSGSAGAALASAGLFGVSFPFWSQAVAAEVYPLHTLFVAGMLWLLLAWRASGRPRHFVLLWLAFGLSLGNHMSTLLLLPGLAFFVWREGGGRRLSPGVWALAVGVAGLGPLTYLYLPLRYTAGPSLNYAATIGVDLGTADGVAWMVRGAMFADLMFGYRRAERPGEAFRLGALLGRAFRGAGPALATLGLVEQWRRDRTAAGALALMGGATVVFYVNYRVPDKNTMFLVPLLVTSVWMAVGIERVLVWAGRGGARLPRRAVALSAAALVAVLALANYPRVDLSGNYNVRRYAEAVLAEVGPEAFIVGGWSRITPLAYLQVVEGRRPDVELFDWGLYGLGRRARLRAQGLAPQEARNTALDEILVIVQRELLAGRRVYSLEDNRLLRESFALVRESHVLRVCEPGACD
jgi:hypothetical protein